MILEIDAGNTRIKWRMLNTGRSAATAASGSVLAIPEGAALLDGLAGQLSEQPMSDVTRVRVSNVRGESFRERLVALLQERWQLEPEFAQVEKQHGGVTNAYENISSMGVDRWLAMVAAYDRSRGACCVLDCGSAITFDWLDAAGQHRGGYIVPGIHVMLDSLVRKSPALAVSPEQGIPEPGRSTAGAIGNGLIAMVLGFAEHCHKTAADSSGKVEWFLTGGDADRLSPYLPWPHTIASELVLDGLALVLP